MILQMLLHMAVELIFWNLLAHDIEIAGVKEPMGLVMKYSLNNTFAHAQNKFEGGKGLVL